MLQAGLKTCLAKLHRRLVYQISFQGPGLSIPLPRKEWVLKNASMLYLNEGSLSASLQNSWMESS